MSQVSRLSGSNFARLAVTLFEVISLGIGLDIFFPVTAVAETSAARPEPKVEQSASYVSQVDQDLTIRRVALLPVADNVDGIYARPIEAQLTALIRSSHRWDIVESGISGTLPSALDLEENPAEVQKLTRTIDAEAFIVAAASRGPNGLSVRLDLFLKKDGRLLAQEILKDHPRFEIPELKEQVSQLYRRVVAKLPYEGLILSRQGNRVTINLGKSDGLTKDQNITAIQVISLNRHPRFGFVISTEKEILGRIKILKVDESLSFGAIVSEKERGAIRRLAKISGIEPVQYPAPDRLGGDGTDITDRADAPVTFGANPKEWLPVHPPSFGLVGVNLGIGTYNSNVNIGAGGALEAKSSPFYPSIGINAELWLNPEWIVRADYQQATFAAANPRKDSAPGELNHEMTKFSFEAAYNLMLTGDFFGPKLQISGGFGSYRMFADQATPVALTTTTFSGFFVGLSGSLPVTDNKEWYLGSKLNLYLMPSLRETPVSSGASSTASVKEFTIYGEKKLTENMRARLAMDFALYSASFSGQGSRVDANGTPEQASSLSQNHKTINAGIIYMF